MFSKALSRLSSGRENVSRTDELYSYNEYCSTNTVPNVLRMCVLNQYACIRPCQPFKVCGVGSAPLRAVRRNNRRTCRMRSGRSAVVHAAQTLSAPWAVDPRARRRSAPLGELRQVSLPARLLLGALAFLRVRAPPSRTALVAPLPPLLLSPLTSLRCLWRHEKMNIRKRLG